MSSISWERISHNFCQINFWHLPWNISANKSICSRELAKFSYWNDWMRKSRWVSMLRLFPSLPVIGWSNGFVLSIVLFLDFNCRCWLKRSINRRTQSTKGQSEVHMFIRFVRMSSVFGQFRICGIFHFLIGWHRYFCSQFKVFRRKHGRKCNSFSSFLNVQRLDFPRKNDYRRDLKGLVECNKCF